MPRTRSALAFLDAAVVLTLALPSLVMTPPASAAPERHYALLDQWTEAAAASDSAGPASDDEKKRVPNTPASDDEKERSWKSESQKSLTLDFIGTQPLVGGGIGISLGY